MTVNPEKAEVLSTEFEECYDLVVSFYRPGGLTKAQLLFMKETIQIELTKLCDEGKIFEHHLETGKEFVEVHLATDIVSRYIIENDYVKKPEEEEE